MYNMYLLYFTAVLYIDEEEYSQYTVEDTIQYVHSAHIICVMCTFYNNITVEAHNVHLGMKKETILTYCIENSHSYLKI